MPKEIIDLYKKARLTPPKHKGEEGIFNLKFHKCVVDVLLKIRKGELPAKSSAYAICMASIGKNKAVKKTHQK